MEKFEYFRCRLNNNNLGIVMFSRKVTKIYLTLSQIRLRKFYEFVSLIQVRTDKWKLSMF